jgi:hypothetical protein
LSSWQYSLEDKDVTAMKITCWLASVVVVVAALGCSKAPVAESETPAASSPSPTVAQETPGEAHTPTVDRDTYQPAEPVVNAPAAVLPVTAASAPEQVVTEFLNAMKTGNEGVAAGLLTAKARTETAKHSLAVQPPGSPSAEYEVAKGEVAAEDPTLAQVGCLWIEKDEEGTEHREQVVWVLRKEVEGWRVCGMATQMPTREEPVFFDFEDPAEMNLLMEQIAQEMQAAQTATAGVDNGGPAAQEARNPETGNTLRQ